MADYWKSIPRKFCDFCKCWLTDNKPSVEFHERGRKHQNNVQKKIGELRRKGQKMAQEEKNTDRMMKQMEQNAMKAFSKDIVTNPDLSAKSGNFAAASVGSFSSYSSGGFSGASFKVKVWFQEKSEDGTKYYWNCETGASQWEIPEEGYVTLREQEEPENNLLNLGTLKPQLKIPEELIPEIEANKQVPQPEPPPPPVTFNKNPYGSWVTVSTSRPKQIDFQLPKLEERVEIVIPEVYEEPQMKFEEKVMPNLNIKTSNSQVGFKKRKINDNFKRNIRQKLEDEET
uniref:WW domain-containing protein n=1 Tax=Strigamia maritima TaxID=126957 RepID=T1IPJ5_STRMM